MSDSIRDAWEEVKFRFKMVVSNPTAENFQYLFDALEALFHLFESIGLVVFDNSKRKTHTKYSEDLPNIYQIKGSADNLPIPIYNSV